MSELLPIAPGDRTIVVDGDFNILFTDIPFATEFDETPRLQHVIGPEGQDILRLVEVALIRPGQIVESDVIFRSEQKLVRVMHIAMEGRTQIIFSPSRT